MSHIGKIQPIIILGSALIGLCLGAYTSFGNGSSNMIEVFLMLLLYLLFLMVDLKQLKKAYENVKYTVTAVTINFLITPIVAYALGMCFFAESMDIRMGLVMLLVTPCTDWYIVFTGLSKGNVELNMSILPINLVLQIVLMPVYLFFFFGNTIEVNQFDIIKSIVLVLIIPFVLALASKKLIENKSPIKKWLDSQCDNLQLFL